MEFKLHYKLRLTALKAMVCFAGCYYLLAVLPRPLGEGRPLSIFLAEINTSYIYLSI